MYEAFYGFKQRPFSLSPDPGFLYLSKKHQTALSLLEYSLLNQAAFSVITGEIGTGKTTLIRYLLHHIEGEFSVGLITNTHANFGELLQWALMALGLEYREKGKVELYQILYDYLIQEYAQNRQVLLIIDEAQNLGLEALEELRMLSNINTDDNQLLQIMLSGQPGLRSLLKQPELEQFAQRIAVDYHLQALDQRETYEYIYHRIDVAGGEPLEIFDWDACGAIYLYSRGVPRLINLLLDTALVYGFAEQKKQISIELIQQVIRDKQQGGIFPVQAQDVGIQAAKLNGQLDAEVPWPPKNKILTAVDHFGESSNEKEVIETTLEEIGYSITKDENTDEWSPSWESGKESLYTPDLLQKKDACFEHARQSGESAMDTYNKGREKYHTLSDSAPLKKTNKSKGFLFMTVLVAAIALAGIIGIFFPQSLYNLTLMQNMKTEGGTLNTNLLLEEEGEKPVVKVRLASNNKPVESAARSALEKGHTRVSLDSGDASAAAKSMSKIPLEDILATVALDQEASAISPNSDKAGIDEIDKTHNNLKAVVFSENFAANESEIKSLEIPEKKQVQQVVVQRGDSLTEILINVYGGFDEALLREVLQLNPNIRDRNVLFVGQAIDLPLSRSLAKSY